MSKVERDAMRDAIAGGRDRRKEIKAEWDALALEPRVQSPAEMRRVLMTWTKDALVEFTIRADSDAIKANRKRLDAWAEAQKVRTDTLILPRETRAHRLGHADPFNAWLINHKGQTLDAKTVFLEGWKARGRAEEAMSDERFPAPTTETEEQNNA